MDEHVPSALAAWEAFYVIVGSSSAALIGLQFVVVVLGSDRGMLQLTTMRAFATPTIVHFSAVLLVSAILSAPWHLLSYPALGLGAMGAVGLVYVLMIARRARLQTDYVPVLEDWIWHTALPFLAYAAILGAAIGLSRHAVPSLFVVGGSAVLVLFVGIHNAWDAVAYIALTRSGNPDAPVSADEP